MSSINDQPPPPAPVVRSTAIAPDALRSRVASMVAEHGPTRAARRLGVGREVCVRVVAGLPIRRGSLALLAIALDPMGNAAP